MSFFDIFSRSDGSAETVVLIDIAADSVGGAYARHEKNALPTILYTARLPITPHEHESSVRAMIRTLKLLGDDLITKGAPELARATGSGAANLVLVSVDAPWQETTIHAENFEGPEPFVFTRSLVEKKLLETRNKAPDRMLADESIIGTILNGYATRDPYGKRVHRASVIILTSLIEKNAAHEILSVLRGTFHTGRILPIAGNSLRYQAVRALFPLEKDSLVLDASDSTFTTLSLVRGNLLVAMTQTQGSVTDPAWATKLTDEFARLATSYPLPRTIFLLTREADTAAAQKALGSAGSGTVWLSDNPPHIVSIMTNQLSGSVKITSPKTTDLAIALMAIYYQIRDKGAEFGSS